jgi:hypothetical protein
MEPNLRQQLQHHFREQQRFADGYSPLYAHLFGVLADWLAGDAADPLVEWLLAAAAGREPFDVTLLLPAALHRDVLAGEPAAAALGRFYATAGGRFDAGDAGALAAALRHAILARQEPLAAFIRRATVQTNETGRGLVWLLPVARLGWREIHLVELGASAGLNLVAERRAYRLVDADDPPRTLLELGEGRPPQFTTLVGAHPRVRPAEEGRHGGLPLQVLSRTGGDVAPFRLKTAEDELTLAAFVWGDQPARVARLREGIAALREVETSVAPVRLRPLRLPDELPAFLERDLPRPLAAPVVLFNTTITMYLPERGAALRQMIGAWAERQDVPVLWLQWEPAWDGPEPPVHGWLAWTADYWPGHRPGYLPNDGAAGHRQLRLAWVHAHGGALEFGENWAENFGKSM